MARRREEGYCEVSTKRGGAWHLDRDQYAPVRMAWTKGVRFVDTVDFYGAPITLKLDEVDAVALITADVVQARLAEKRQDDADDSLHGEPC